MQDEGRVSRQAEATSGRMDTKSGQALADRHGGGRGTSTRVGRLGVAMSRLCRCHCQCRELRLRIGRMA